MRFPMLIAAAALAGIAVPVAAHHGWSSYDESKPVTLNGTFAELSWGNPHGAAKMRWKGKLWDVILAPTSRMEARGLSRAEVEPGKPVRLTGYLRRDGTAEMRIERVMIGKKTVELR
ncbi:MULTISPECIES: DUF6152 family protein [unclassified Sphingopyxis]|jgi:hypothetical protein|uniref:DUF6152 family protein n=1 Tax=unclassified Sphingopyxis TaxID=2614943 RepID=UPI0025DC975E|nr:MULTISPECIES: DUF6152 family protein [unclassified Sphingopyxis]